MSNWYRSFNKISQSLDEGDPARSPVAPVGSQSRYRGIMVYEVRVPRSDQDSQIRSAIQASQDLCRRVQEAVGDEIVSCDEPEFYGNSPR